MGGGVPAPRPAPPPPAESKAPTVSEAKSINDGKTTSKADVAQTDRRAAPSASTSSGSLLEDDNNSPSILGG